MIDYIIMLNSLDSTIAVNNFFVKLLGLPVSNVEHNTYVQTFYFNFRKIIDW